MQPYIILQLRLGWASLHFPCLQNEPILLVNLLQRSRSTFSRGSFLSFFAFQEGMLGTQISALGGWPTVSEPFTRLRGIKILRFLRQTKHWRLYNFRTEIKWCKPVQGGAGGVFLPIARRLAEEYPGATRGVYLCSPTV